MYRTEMKGNDIETSQKNVLVVCVCVRVVEHVCMCMRERIQKLADKEKQIHPNSSIPYLGLTICGSKS